MGITVDVSQIEGFQEKIRALNGTQRDMFFRESCMDGASRLVELVKPLTPAKSGNLRKGWDDSLSSLNLLGVSKSQGAGSVYSVTLENAAQDPVSGVYYASYVENGHRQTPGRYVPAIGKRLVASWVEGKHMLEKSEGTLSGVLPGVLQTKLDAFLRTVF